MDENILVSFLELMKSEIEWEYPIDNQITLDKAIKCVKDLDKIKSILKEYYTDKKVEEIPEISVKILEILGEEINVYEEVQGVFTPGGDPCYKCPKCGYEHVYGIESTTGPYHICPKCKTSVYYPYEKINFKS